VDRLSSAIELDPVLHQPVRTRIAAYLAARGETSFTELKRALDITDGNLEAHMRKFVAAKYVKVRRDSGKGRPQSTYTLTAAGHSVFHDYVDCLQRLLFLET
jgi:predicted ArsR family transcriptional regulator